MAHWHNCLYAIYDMRNTRQKKEIENFIVVMIANKKALSHDSERAFLKENSIAGLPRRHQPACC
jgi:hypothetical protein